MTFGKEDEKYGLIRPTCDLTTVADGRGGIFTFLPKELIVEVDLVYPNPGLGKENIKNDFTEYFLMVEGSGVMVFNDADGRQEIHHMSKGSCTYCTPGVAYSFYAIENNALALVFRSKALNDSPSTSRDSGKFGRLDPSCSMETVIKKREGTFRWTLDKPLKEFNLLYFRPGKSRGDHYHPHFTEYFLILNGSGKMVYKDPENPQGKETVYHMSRGDFVYTTPGIAHAFHAIDDLIAVSMLTKPWDECDPPIVRCNVSRHLEEKE